MAMPYNKISMMITMIILLFAFNNANAACNFTFQKSFAISKVLLMKQTDTQKMMLAKGQNNLPKRHNNKYDQG